MSSTWIAEKGSQRRLATGEGLRLLKLLLRGADLPAATSELKTWIVVAFFALHIPLAFLMPSSAAVPTVHALLTLAAGAWIALFDKRRERVAYVAAYIVGAEVLWRMNDSQVFWEFGKYAVAAVLIAAMVRDRKFKLPVLPTLYLILLLPSILLILDTDFDKFRRALSFNFSGPFALAVCCVYFSQQVLSARQLQHLFTAAIGPILGIAFVAINHTFTEPVLTFTTGSNNALSGGWGANQVSSALGLGGLLAILVALNNKVRWNARIVMLIVSPFLFFQSLVTFSRSGPYLGAGALLAASFYLLRDRVSRAKLFIGIAVLGMAAFFVVPRLNNFTEGKLANRYQDLGSTNRDLIALADLEIWMANPVLGVGPGGSYALHALTFRAQAAHTEYTRLIAEHGIFGLGAMVLLLIIPLNNLRRTRTPFCKAMIVALAAWSLGYLLVNAMRLAAPAFLFGLTCASLNLEGGSGRILAQYFVRLVKQRSRIIAAPAMRKLNSASNQA